jgi:hypothetical protein
VARTKEKAYRAATPEELIRVLRDKDTSWEDITDELNSSFPDLRYTKGTVIALAHRSGVLTTPPQLEAPYERYALPHNPAGRMAEHEERYMELTSYKEIANYQAITSKSEWIHVFAFGDMHLGHFLCDFRKVKEYCEYILHTPDTYCFLMGDLMECAQKNSVGKSKDEEILNASEQWDIAVRLFLPLAKKGKILWGHIGNHEGRVSKNASFEMQEKLFQDVLGVPYLDFEGFTVLRVNEIDYVFYTHHGWGSARTKAGKIKKLEELTTVNDADIYGMGHTHELFEGFLNRRQVDVETMEIKMAKRPIMLTGSFLKYGGYISAKGYPPATLGSPKVELHSVRKKTYIRE